MNCHDCQEWLQRRLDGEAVEDAVVAGHLADCADCRSRLDAAQRLLEGLRWLTPPQPAAGFAQRTLALVLAERRARLRRRWAGSMVAMAASLLVVALVGWNLSRDTDHGAAVADGAPKPEKKTQEIEKPQVKDTPKVVPPAAEPSLRETLQQASTAVGQLTDRLWQTTRDQADVWRDVTAPWEMARLDLSPKAPGGPRRPGQGKSGMTAGLQTVAGLTKRGLGFMLRDTAGLQPGRKAAWQPIGMGFVPYLRPSVVTIPRLAE